MAIYMVKCPKCASPTELNDEKDFGFCTECGARITPDEAELYVPAPDDTPAEAPAEEAPAADTPAAPAEAELPAAEDPPAAEAPAVPDVPVLPNAEQVQFLILHQPQPLDSVLFHSSDECAAYVRSLHSLILEASARYDVMNHAEEATCLDYLERGIGYCEYLDTKRLRFLAGTHEENGKAVEDFGSFPVSKDVLRDLKQTRERFVEAYNGFYKPKIAAAKAALDETKDKIRALPGAMRFYHSFCTPLMGILTAALLAVGLFAVLRPEGGFTLVNTAILVVGAAAFIAWAVCTVLWVIKGGSARQLYKAADRQLNEARTYRAKLKS